MHATATPVAEAFHDLPAVQRLPCGVAAHPVGPSHIDPARAERLDRHDRLTRARHTGWYADASFLETLTGYVYVLAGATDDEAEDDPPPSYYALVESHDTDCHYLDPDVYDDPVTAAHAADRMAELIAELEYECDLIRNRAAAARGELAEANRVRREALAILRHARQRPADVASLGPAFARLWRQGLAGRRRAFDAIDEHRPARRARPHDPQRTPTPDECRADAWRHGWDCGAAA